MCICVPVCSLVYIIVVMQRPEDGIRSSGARIIGSWKLPNEDSGN